MTSGAFVEAAMPELVTVDPELTGFHGVSTSSGYVPDAEAVAATLLGDAQPTLW